MAVKLRIELNHRSFHQLQEIFIEKTNDNRIISCSKKYCHLKKKQKKMDDK